MGNSNEKVFLLSDFSRQQRGVCSGCVGKRMIYIGIQPVRYCAPAERLMDIESTGAIQIPEDCPNGFGLIATERFKEADCS